VGQHKHNPTAIAVASGTIKRSEREARPVAEEVVTRPVSAVDYRRKVRVRRPNTVGTLVRTTPKLRGKANVKRYKKARQIFRRQEAQTALAQELAKVLSDSIQFGTTVPDALKK
jgi:type II secretory pathway component PulC